MLSEKALKQIDRKLEESHQYYEDTRDKYEIELTNRLARSLSELNFTSLKKEPLNISAKRTIKKEDILYVGLSGLPPFQNQFDSLQLPGQFLHFLFPCFEKGLSEEELLTLRTEFEEQAKQLHARINQISTTKPIVFLFHSFGSYLMATYCDLYNTDRIIGIIDVGGAPIRFYPVLMQTIRNQYQITLQTIVDNLDIVYQAFLERNKKFGLNQYENKYQALGVMRAFKSEPGFRSMFQKLRRLPNVLKCYIYGRDDKIFPEDLLNEKVAFYSYKNKFDPSYQLKLDNAYERYFGTRSNNVQERFVFSIEGGYHSIHMQRKYKDTVAAIVHRYLTFLEQVHSQEAPKM